mgnify:CR=1 FL=1
MSKHNSDNSSNASDEETILNPYNPKNKVITVDVICRMLSKNGVMDIDPGSIEIERFISSTLHKSYTYSNNYELSRCKEDKYTLTERPSDCLDFFKCDSYEKLEFMGDRVLELVIVHYIYSRFIDTNEGFMTKLKTRIVKTNSLATFAKYIGLDEYLIISRHVEEKGEGRKNDRILEDTFEAFIGALFLNFNEGNVDFKGYGYGICETFIHTILEKTVDFEDLIMNDDNFKDILLRYFQHTFSITPKYVQLETTGETTNRIFTMVVLDPHGHIVG